MRPVRGFRRNEWPMTRSLSQLVEERRAPFLTGRVSSGGGNNGDGTCDGNKLNETHSVAPD